MVKGKLKKTNYFFPNTFSESIPDPPTRDAYSACLEYFKAMTKIVLECYEKFGPLIDPDQFYTKNNLEKLGLSVEDIEEALLGYRGWTDVPGITLETRLKLLRDSVPGCSIDYIFEEYLGHGRDINQT